MAILVKIEDFKSKSEIEFFDKQNAFYDILNYCYLNPTAVKVFKYIDLYDDTVFNSLQIKDLIDDIQVLKKTSSILNSQNNYLLENLDKLCKQALKEPHIYLKFYGD